MTVPPTPEQIERIVAEVLKAHRIDWTAPDVAADIIEALAAAGLHVLADNQVWRDGQTWRVEQPERPTVPPGGVERPYLRVSDRTDRVEMGVVFTNYDEWPSLQASAARSALFRLVEEPGT